VDFINAGLNRAMEEHGWDIALNPDFLLPGLRGSVMKIRRMAMIFQSYWDDSEDDASKFFGVGGFVGREDAWESLEAQWLTALPDRIEVFSRYRLLHWKQSI
jgi:hypothetical protein